MFTCLLIYGSASLRQILASPFNIMLLQCLRERSAIFVQARQLVVMIYGGINFLVSQSEARRGTGSLQRFEELLRQSVVFTSESLAGIEGTEETQAAAAHVHQFVQS